MYCEILKTDEESIPAQPNIRIRVALGSSPGSTAFGAGVVVVVVACGVVLVLVVVNICVVVEFVLARLEVIRLLVTFGEGVLVKFEAGEGVVLESGIGLLVTFGEGVLVRFETGEGVVLDSAELAVGDGVLLLELAGTKGRTIHERAISFQA